MKKIILSFTLLLFAITGFSQQNKGVTVYQQNKPVKIDSLVTVVLPVGYQVKDTLGQQIYSANGLYGYMIAIREANAKNNAPLKKEKDLNKVLKDYVKGIQGQSGDGAALHVRDSTIGTLKAKVFTLKNDDGTGTATFRNFILLYTQDATYTFEYVYPENRSELIKDEYKAYASSIKLSPGLQRNDQYISNDNGLSSITKIEIIGGGGLLVLIIVLIVIKRKNRLVVD